MYRCAECGHHHGQGNTWLPCGGLSYTESGGIARCNCHHTTSTEQEAA